MLTCVKFLAPTIVRPLKRNDVIIIRNFSGQNAGSPTNCFTGKRPIFLAKLVRKGLKTSIIEFIPLNKKLIKPGLKLTNFVSRGSCTLGPESVPKFRGTVVSCSCRCKRCLKKKNMKRKIGGL